MSAPLDDARTLFGDAMQARKPLRRAYARLIRQHPPDTDATRFQQIRAAYEAALEALENPEAAEEESSQSVEAMIADLSPANFDAVHAALVAQANNYEARQTALFLAHAIRPDTILAWIAEQRRAGLRDEVLFNWCLTLLDVRPPLAHADLLDAFDTTLEPRLAAVLTGHRVRAYVRAEAYAPGFDLWRIREGALRSHDPAAWDLIADAILYFAADRTPADVLETIEDAIEDIALDLDEDDYARLRDGVFCARALQGLAADPACPSELVEALRFGLRSTGAFAFSTARQCRHALGVVGDGNLDRGVMHLRLRHPTAYRMLREVEHALTGRLAFQDDWCAEQAPPQALPADLEALVDAVITPAPARVPRWQAALILASVLFVVPQAAYLAGTPWLFAILLIAPLAWGTDRLLRPLRRRKRPGAAAIIAGLDDIQRLYGTWRHELMAAVTRSAMPVSVAIWTRIADDHNADLRCLSPAHGFRASQAPATEEEPPETAEEDEDERAG